MWVRIYLTLLLGLGFVLLITYWLKQSQAQAPASDAWQRFWHKVAKLVNPLLRSVGMEPIWVLPASEDALQAKLDTVRALAVNINETLAANPHIDTDKKAAIRRQVRKIPANIVALAWKLHRLHRLQTLLGNESNYAQELTDLANHLQTAIDSAHNSLQTISVSLLKLELADNQDITAQLIDDLAQTNQRMQDLLKAREVVKRR